VSFISSDEFVYSGGWTTRPDAANFQPGRLAWMDDVGPSGSSWVSDGTYWRPLNGLALLYIQAGTIAAPVSTLTGNGTSQNFVLPEPCLIPGGMLFPGCRIDVDAVFYKEGTHTGTVLGYLSSSASPANPALDDFINRTSVTGNPSAVKFAQQIFISNGVWLEQQQAAFWTDASAAQVPADHADAGVNSADRYIGFSIGTSYTTNLCRLLGYAVRIYR
jgi:hypothetical protein